ncbi:MAG: 30S ribosomal protein S6 [Candidatus Pacebacteria bacterium]|nr:30S ribosomal protein S6 [Candidatus Paceibacterota bacterium]MCD8508005.1 30S ribosomal protein S6 [Candidatus Paceibacterota bacterium]MCD8528242.1 30S ribosomal protein S6 [Candidatus Paceibacterota bacterium]MCD8564051.1 30S ribosomal protein S6 [Candidatus Paceibacterota bacterium]
MAQKTLEQDVTDLREPRVYELSYLIIPTVGEEGVAEQVDSLRKIITDNGGLPIVEGDVELIELAYEMRVVIENAWKVYDRGYFGWFTFDVTPDKIEAMHALLKDHDALIRFLLIKSDRDAAVARPRFTPSQKVTAEAVEVSSEDAPTTDAGDDELDQQIDELVADQETSENNE